MLQVPKIQSHRNSVHRQRNIRTLRRASQHKALPKERRGSQLHTEVRVMQRTTHSMEQRLPDQTDSAGQAGTGEKKPAVVLPQLRDNRKTLSTLRLDETRKRSVSRGAEPRILRTAAHRHLHHPTKEKACGSSRSRAPSPGNERATPRPRTTSRSTSQQTQGSHQFCVFTPEDGDIFARNKADLFQAMENRERGTSDHREEPTWAGRMRNTNARQQDERRVAGEEQEPQENTTDPRLLEPQPAISQPMNIDEQQA